MKNKTGKIIFVVLSIIIILISIGFFVMKGVVSNAKNIQVESVDIKKTPDGNYQGEYKLTPVYAAVEVTVKESTIEKIEIIQHDKGLGKRAEEIINTIIKVQSLDVDAITGATVSSKAILKAVEQALIN